jgi:hypothetical protein
VHVPYKGGVPAATVIRSGEVAHARLDALGDGSSEQVRLAARWVRHDDPDVLGRESTENRQGGRGRARRQDCTSAIHWSSLLMNRE